MNRLLLVLPLLCIQCSGGGGTGGTAGGGGGSAGGSGGGAANGCGNGTLETNEACEGFELRNKTCLSEGFDRGTISCSSSCTLDTSRCSRCGDGRISGDEVCDTNAADGGDHLFGGKTCATQVDAGSIGELQCSACTNISASQCRFPPGRGEPCSTLAQCTAGLVCDLLTLRCQQHCEAADIGTMNGCGARTCTDGGVQAEGQLDMPPTIRMCTSQPCGAGFSCLDGGTAGSFCYKYVGLCL